MKKADWEFCGNCRREATGAPGSQAAVDEDNNALLLPSLQGAKRAVPRGNPRGKIWWTDAAATAVEERKQAAEAYKRDTSPELFAVLNELRANTDRVIATGKRTCWRNRVSELKSDCNAWKLLAAIEGKRRGMGTIVDDCRKSDQSLADKIVRGYVPKNRNVAKSQDIQEKIKYRTATHHVRKSPSTAPECLYESFFFLLYVG